MARRIFFQQDDDEVRFVLDQHAELDLYSAGLLKQQSAGRHVTPHSDTLFCIWNRIGGVMVSVLASSAVDIGFEPQSGQTKDFKIGICCFCVKHAALRSKS
jgi:hypothetical protein